MRNTVVCCLNAYDKTFTEKVYYNEVFFSPVWLLSTKLFEVNNVKPFCSVINSSTYTAILISKWCATWKF